MSFCKHVLTVSTDWLAALLAWLSARARVSEYGAARGVWAGRVAALAGEPSVQREAALVDLLDLLSGDEVGIRV